MMTMAIEWWLLMGLVWMSAANLLCNGDFEAYKLTTFITYNNILYGTNTFPSNTSCWYSNRADFQVQKTIYGTGTQCIELSYMFSYYELCQNVTLVPGYLYQLEYDVSLLPQVTSVTAYTYLNGKSLMNVSNSNYSSVVHGKMQFTANISNNKICTNGTANVPFGVSQLLQLYTPLLDNFNLTLVSNPTNTTNNTNSNITNSTNITNNTISTTNSTINSTNNVNNITNNNTNITNNTNATNNSINITNNTIITNNSITNNSNNSISNNINSNNSINISNNSNSNGGYIVPTQYNISGGTNPTFYFNIQFQQSTDDIQGIIYLNSTTLMTQSILSQVKQSVKIYIQGELQTHTIYYLDGNGFACILIYCERSYDLRTVFITFPPHLELSNMAIYLVITINGQQFIVYFLPTNLAKIVSDTQPISTTVLDAITKGYNFLRTFFFSYFLVNLINFFTLTLMYNFLNIATQPNFSHNFLEKLAQIIYLQNSLSGTIKKIFTNSNYENIFNFSRNVESPQKITMFYGVYAWFGKMGLTYNYFANNFQTIIIVLLSIVKLILLKTVMGCLPKISSFLFGKEVNGLKYFVIDFISVTPIMTVSAFCTILNFGDAMFKQKINSLLQIITLFVIISLPFAYLVLQVQQIQRKYESKEAHFEKQIVNKKTTIKIKQALFDFFKYSLNIIIPLLVVLEQKIAFFAVISIIIAILWGLYIKGFKHLKFYERFFSGLQIFILLVHHLIFLFMYVAQFLKMNSQLMNVLMISGLIIIFTVICGGALELIDFALCLVYTIFSMIIKFCKIQFWKKTKSSTQLQKKIPILDRKRKNIVNLTGLGNVMYIKAEKISQIKKVYENKKKKSKISKTMSINLNQSKQNSSLDQKQKYVQSRKRVKKSSTLNNSLNLNKLQSEEQNNTNGKQIWQSNQKTNKNERLRFRSNSEANQERGESQVIEKKVKNRKNKAEGSIVILLREKEKSKLLKNGEQRW